MKTKTKNTIKVLGLVILLAGMLISSKSQAQCNSSYAYTLNPNGNVYFQSTSNGTVNPSYFLWQFGNGNQTMGTSPTAAAAYTANGTYTVCLSIWLNNTVSPTPDCSICQTITINNVLIPCNVVASYTSSQGINGNVQFASTSTGTFNPTSYNWSFGDGTFGTGPNPLKTYTANGVYSPYLYIISGTGVDTCYAFVTQTISVNSVTMPPCQASFNYSPSVGGNALFWSNSTNTTLPTYYSWNFGNGMSGVGPNAATTYSANGTYTVCLTISNGTVLPNCSSTSCQTINIMNAGTCTQYVNVNLYKDMNQPLTWYAVPVYGGSVVAATWTWGDGNTSNGLYPSHVYANAASYSICVNATLTCGTASYCTTQNIYKSASGTSNAMVTVNVMQNFPTGTSLKTEEITTFTNVKLFPNPTVENVKIALDSKAQSIIEINVVNVTGQVVLSENKTLEAGNNLLDVETKHLSNGVYFIKINNQNSSNYLKFIKKSD